MAGAEADWCHRTSFDATPLSAAAARAFVSRHLVEHRLLHLVDPVRLVTSELATNALVHGRNPFVVTLSREDDTVRVTVCDESAWVGGRASEELLGDGGRGLVIVKVVSHDWGVITDAASKTVWASFDIRQTRPC